MIKPAFFDNEDLADCDPFARLLFIGLWCLADREGKLLDKPKRIKKAILGYDSIDIDYLLGQLLDKGLIIRYTTEQGENCLLVSNFLKYQNPFPNEKASELPYPSDYGQKCYTNVEQDNDIGCVSAVIETAYLTSNKLEVTSNKLQVIDNTELNFEKFWKAYPRKESKIDARKAFMKLKPDDELLDKILSAIEARKQTKAWQGEKRFIVLPAGWLRGERWEDEIDEEEQSTNTFDILGKLYQEFEQEEENDKQRNDNGTSLLTGDISEFEEIC